MIQRCSLLASNNCIETYDIKLNRSLIINVYIKYSYINSI